MWIIVCTYYDIYSLQMLVIPIIKCMINIINVARVTQINPRWARCAILCVKDVVLSEPFRGQLRKEDVRATEKDRVELYHCFRPNDIILARVVSFFPKEMHFYSLKIIRTKK